MNNGLTLKAETIGALWLGLLKILHEKGASVFPRNKECFEFINVTLRLDEARNNVFVHPVRNLSYRFMVAEWLWILFGHDDVATISQYNKNIAQFSDNGVDFNGSYGRPVKAQWDTVRDSIRDDPYTRQAVVVIFGSERSRKSRDVPCTISLQFFLRFDKLETTVMMRSSDIMLGLPYDVFNFTMLANAMAGELGVELGGLTLHLGSSHLYKVDQVKAAAILEVRDYESLRSPALPGRPPTWLERTLMDRSMDAANWTPHELLEVWQRYGRVLAAKTNSEGLIVLRELAS